MKEHTTKDMKECNYTKCEYRLPASIETGIGWFCTDECRQAVARRIQLVLMGYNPDTTEPFKVSENETK